MSWQQLIINTNASLSEKISDYLQECGALSTTFVDHKDTPIYEPKLGKTELWQDTDVVALFAENQKLDSLILNLSKEFKLEDKQIKQEKLADQDWVRAWMSDFHPMQFGQKLWICPSNIPIVDPDAVNILLDPGLAFGTGTHETTALCLEYLDSQSLRGKSVLDFGCGSGILAIAALKLGANKAYGIDIDDQAITASLSNAKANQVEQNLNLFLAEQTPENLKVDLVIANILASVLCELKNSICKHVKTGGKIALSGILVEQIDKVLAKYQDEFFLEVKTKGDWAIIFGTKK